jgi:hypothetical protein
MNSTVMPQALGKTCITIQTMSSRLRRWLNDPLVLLCIVAGLLAFVVQSGELGTADTMHRLQTTHWLWTSEPQVFPNEYPEFGLHGRGGQIYSWYGIGQSLLMLPADLVGTWIAHWHFFLGYGDDPAVRSIVVSYSTSILVNVLTVLVGFRLLRQLRFTVKESILGLLALLFCTTHLHYTQNLMENNYIMLLTLTGFSFQYEWLRTGSKWALFGRARAQLTDQADHGAGPCGGRYFSSSCIPVRAGARTRTMEAVRSLLQGRRSRLCFFPRARPALPVLPFRIIYQYLRIAVCKRAALAGPNPPGEFSLEYSFLGRRSGTVV